jgi:hypothetical protein
VRRNIFQEKYELIKKLPEVNQAAFMLHLLKINFLQMAVILFFLRWHKIINNT